jgi:hypothetical protein
MRNETFEGEEVLPYLPYIEQLEEEAKKVPIAEDVEFEGHYYTVHPNDAPEYQVAKIIVKNVPVHITRLQVRNWVVNKTGTFTMTDEELRYERATRPQKDRFLELLDDASFVANVKTKLGL